MKKNYFCNPATCSCENGKYLPSIMDDSTIMCDKVIESYNEDAKSYNERKPISTNFNGKKASSKMQNVFLYLHFH